MLTPDLRTTEYDGCPGLCPVPAGGVMLEAKKILVPVNGNATDARTISLACQMAKRSKGRVYAIYVIEVRRNMPLDADLIEDRAQADAILDAAERTAATWDQEV